MSKPQTLEDLRIFYLDEYLPLYDRFVVAAHVPQELHAEVAAAFDHLMRQPISKITDTDLDRIAGHLKRATFDSFKLIFEKEIRERYNRLMSPVYVNVEDGKFQPKIQKLFDEAQKSAIAARNAERLSSKVNVDAWNQAFDLWKKILPIADTFQSEEFSEKIIRVARNRRRDIIIRCIVEALEIVLSAFAGAIVAKYFF